MLKADFRNLFFTVTHQYNIDCQEIYHKPAAYILNSLYIQNLSIDDLNECFNDFHTSKSCISY